MVAGSSAPGDATLKNNRLAGLDQLRFFCAVSVMMFHLAYWSWCPEGSTPRSVLQGAAAYPELAAYTWWGWVGVDVFFVISGFVISMSATNATPLSFLRSRFLRLAPALWICATVTLIVGAASGWHPLPELAKMYAHTIVLDPRGGWIDGVYWTLTIEVAFYALTWLLLLAGRLQWLPAVMVTLSSASCAVWLSRLGHVAGMGTPDIPISRASQLFIDYWPFFAIGVLIQGKSAWRLPAIAALSVLSIVPVVMASTGYVYPEAGLLVRAIAPVMYVAGVIAIVLLCAYGAAIERALPARATRLIVFVGFTTYPLYLMHDVVGASCVRALVSVGMNRFAALALSMAAMVAAAAFVTAVLEPRLRVLLSRAFPRTSVRPAAA